jgi:hypothetical protein
MVNKLGIQASYEDACALVDRVDQGGTGSLTLDDFISLISRDGNEYWTPTAKLPKT